MSLIAVGALAGTLVLAGCGSGSDQGNGAASKGNNASVSYNDADVTFATDMIGHHRQAVEMAQMVIDRGVTPEVKALAARIKAEQDPEIIKLSGFLTSFGKPVPSESMGMAHGGGHQASGMMSAEEMAKLESLSGKELEKAFLTDMIEHHSGAVEMSSTELKDGKHAPAKDLAQQITTAQTAEIAQMKALLTQFS